MNRRIVKVLVSLLTLLCILPVFAGAAEYQVGDTLWTAGEKPTADTEQYSRWIPVIRSDNVQEFREVGKTGTYEYQWIVEEYYGPGEKEGIPTSFAVKNVDPQGDPMVGTEFILFEERGDNLLLIASAVTDEEGVAKLEDLCLDDTSDSAVWHLVQTNFPESKMAETHHPYTGMWDVYVERDPSGTHTMEMVPAPAAQTMALGRDDAEVPDDLQIIDFSEVSGKEPIEENYNEKAKVLTVVNEEITGEMTIYVEFEDGVVPKDVGPFAIDIISPDGNEETVNLFPGYLSARFRKLALGQYIIREQTGKIEATGYNFKTKYTVQLIGEDPTESQAVTLTKEKPAATVTITNIYEEINIANTILAKVMDENGNLLNGAELELLDANDNVIRTVGQTSAKGTFQFDDLADQAVKGKTVTFKIRQSKAPSGYHKCEDQYIISVEKKNGKVTVSAKRDANFFARLFRSGEDTGAGGETIIEFKNETILGNLSIKAVNMGDKCPVDKIPLTVTGQNYQTKETLSESNGWQIELKDLPMSKYTIRQDADAKGYNRTDAYAASGGIMTGNQVELTRENAEVTITNTYSLQTGKVLVQMEFAEDVIPPAVTKIPVKVTGSALYTELDIERTADVTAANQWKAELELPLGNYSLVQDVTNAQVNGYELTPDAEQKSVTLAAEGEEKIFTFENRYIEVRGQLPEKVVILAQDQNGEPVEGCEFTLSVMGTSKVFPSTNDQGQTVIEDLQSLMDNFKGVLPAGETKATLTQSKVPEGYKQAEESYEIVVQNNKQTGEITYEVPGANINEERILLTFINTKKSTEPPTTDPTDPNNPSNPDEPTDPNNSTNPTNPTNPSATSPKLKNRISIRTLDSKGAPLAGAKYSLYFGASAIRSYTDYGTGQIDIKDLDMLLGNYTDSVEMKKIMGALPLTLRQTQAPLAGELSSKSYNVYIYPGSEGVMVEVEGSEVDSNGVQLVDFVHPAREQEQPTQPTVNLNPAKEDKDPGVIVIRTVDESGNVLTGAEYCLSTDLHFDKDKDIVYSKADRHGEITLDDLEEHVEKGKTATYYLLQSRQPENGSLSAERFVVELSRKKGDLEVEVKKDAGILERMQGGGVEESTTGEWIVTFSSTAKTMTIQIACEEVIHWNNCLETEEVLQQYKKDEYQFLLNWEYAGEEKEPLTMKLGNGKTGSFDPIPYGAKYEVVPVQDGCYKMEITKGEQKGYANKENLELQAKVTYNVDTDKPLVLEMVKIDSRTKSPLLGVEYTLKNAAKEEIDIYKTDGSGKLRIDGITEPGEYTLSENEVPDGYQKLKKDIGISVSVGFEEAQDAHGDPVILQTLEAVVSHSQVRQHADGSYRIGTLQRSNGGKLPIILAGAGAAVAVAAGAGVAVLHNKKKKLFKR